VATVAVTVIVPVDDGVTVVVASPSESVPETGFESEPEPLAIEKTTSAPCTGLPPASVTVIVRGALVDPTLIDWVLPETTERCAGVVVIVVVKKLWLLPPPQPDVTAARPRAKQTAPNPASSRARRDRISPSAVRARETSPRGASLARFPY